MSYRNDLDPYEALANGIIIQAVKDYRWACKRLKNPRCQRSKRQEAEMMKDDCLRFFRSQWFGQLTEVEPEYLIRKLNEEADA